MGPGQPREDLAGSTLRMMFWIDRSTQSLALRAPSRKWAKCARPPLWPARHPFFSPCTSAGAAAHWAGVCTAGRDRHRPRRLNSTYYVDAREIGTRTDRARWTRRSGTSRGIAVLDGLGYFVFLLMRRSSSCRQRLAVAAPAAIAHPKRDVNIRLRSFDEKSPSSSRCDSTCCSGWSGRM